MKVQNIVISAVLGLVAIAISLYFGFELPLYIAISLIGTFMWTGSDDPMLTLVGGYIARIGFTLFVIAFLYYFFSGHIFYTKPFEFRFLKFMAGLMFSGWNFMSTLIGRTALDFMNATGTLKYIKLPRIGV